MTPTTVYGIDFGTTTTFLSRQDTSQTDVDVLNLTGTKGKNYLDSVVYFDGKNYSFDRPDSPDFAIIKSPKMMITSGQFSQEVTIQGKTFIVEAASAVTSLLQKVIEEARERHGIVDFEKQPIRFGCPSSWGSVQRKELLKAIVNAGLKRVTLVDVKDEAVACGVYYLHQLNKVEEIQGSDNRILVFDMGGGTLDVALLRIKISSPNADWSVSVLASESNEEAGYALDKKLATLISDKFREAGGVEITELLISDAESVKKQLSTVQETSLFDISGKIKISISRKNLESEFESLRVSASSLIDEVLIKSALRQPPHSWLVEKLEQDGIPADQIENGINRNENQVSERIEVSTARARINALISEVDTVILAGGMSRIPAISDFLREKFPQANLVDLEDAKGDIQADQLVARGLVAKAPFSEISAFRPPFDLNIHYISESGKEEVKTIFSAYDSIWDSHSHQKDFMVGAELIFNPEERLTSNDCVLEIARPDGKAVEVRLDEVLTAIEREVLENPAADSIVNESTRTKIHVKYGGSGITVKLYASGLLVVRDSAGAESAYQTLWPEAWSSSDKQVLRLRYFRPSENTKRSYDKWRHK